MSSSPVDTPPPGVHPLEVLPPFRRVRASPLRNLVYTFVWNCLVALALTAADQLLSAHPAPLGRNLAAMLVGANLVGFMIHGALYALRRFAPRMVAGPGWRPRLAQMGVSGLGALVGIALMRVLLSQAHPLDVLRSGAMATVAVYAVGTAILIRAVLYAGERRIERETQAARQQEQIAAAGRLLAEARLRALQAQIEPHFLYNTLANVVSLIDTRPAQARRMLERFIDYLRASLAASRAESATLGGELELVRAYLDVLGVRLGARLRYAIEADADCRRLPIAPMLLQPLVENAIMHGIEPKLEGGEIVVRARVTEGALCVEVSDTGMGLGPGAIQAAPRPGGGVGLSNLRERLRQLHGPGAQLQLIENHPCGLISRLLLPFTEVPPSTRPAP